MDTSKPVDGKVGTPAYVANNPSMAYQNEQANANLPIFTNPVEGNVDTGVVHSGDLGRGLTK